VVGVFGKKAADHRWVVDSPAIGTGLHQQPCGDTLRPAEPPPSDDPIAVTMSGGGFRASLPAVGVARLFAATGVLPNLRYGSSVSGRLQHLRS
jgi:NTE family protein